MPKLTDWRQHAVVGVVPASGRLQVFCSTMETLLCALLQSSRDQGA